MAPQQLPNPAAGRHLPALDGLRGVAILSVMLFHYVTASGFGDDAWVTRKIIGACGCLWTGVDVFFVLSGFLITGILLRAKGSPGYFVNFYMRRLLRIFPLYYGALVVIFLIVPHLVHDLTPGVKRILDSQGWMWGYSQDFAITLHNQDYFDVDWMWVGHFWSLGVEERFYLVWPLIVFALGPRALIATCLGLVALAPVVRIAMLAHHMAPAAIYTLTFSRTDELALGSLIAVAARTTDHATLSRWARWAVAGSVGYLVLAVAYRRSPFTWDHWTALGFGFTALAFGAAGLLVLAIGPRRTLLSRVLESRALRTLGTYSYGAYVIHTPMQPLYLRILPPQRIGALAAPLGHTASRLIGLLGFTVLAMGSTLTLAVVSFHSFERPFTRLKRYFEYGRAPALGVVPSGTAAP